MRGELEFFPKLKNYWTGQELRNIEIANNQLQILRDAAEEGRKVPNIVKVTVKGILPTLKEYANQNLTPDKIAEIKNLIEKIEALV